MESLKILIPTDFSVQAEFAYLMVKKLEEKIPVEIHFLHVLGVPDTVTMDKNGQIDTCGDISIDFVLSQKNIAERKLANLKTLYGDQIQTHFEVGKLIDKIISFSELNHFDLIVMGRTGAWGLKEKLATSETQMVARRSKVPLLSLMCDRSDLIIKNILLVHDFSEPKALQLSLLHKLIKAFNTKTHLLQIISKQDDSKKAKLLKSMDDFANLNLIANYEKHLLNDLDVENGVTHFVEMKEMDIICIGTHGKAGLFHTSATEKLINHMFKPIITYHLNN